MFFPQRKKMMIAPLQPDYLMKLKHLDWIVNTDHSPWFSQIAWYITFSRIEKWSSRKMKATTNIIKYMEKQRQCLSCYVLETDNFKPLNHGSLHGKLFLPPSSMNPHDEALPMKSSCLSVLALVLLSLFLHSSLHLSDPYYQPSLNLASVCLSMASAFVL